MKVFGFGVSELRTLECSWENLWQRDRPEALENAGGLKVLLLGDCKNCKCQPASSGTGCEQGEGCTPNSGCSLLRQGRAVKEIGMQRS